MKMHRTNIFLPLPMVKKLQEVSKSKGISMSELIRRILDEWVEKLRND